MRVVTLLASVFRTGLVAALLVIVANAARAEGPSYLLGPGDRLRITVFELPELSGEFSVGPAATLSFPLLGRLSVAGLSLVDLETNLADRLIRSGGVKDPRVSIEIVAYRPFFILGAVQAPGQYPYVHDMTVLHAISIAGGFNRIASPDALVNLELGRVRERYLATGEAIAINLARRARLRAERDAVTKIAFPAQIVEFTSEARVAEITANEQRSLEQRALSFKSEMSLLASQKDIIAEEIGALEKQLVSKGRLAEINQQEMSEIDKLRQRDLIPLTRVLALRRSATEIESDRIQLIASIARAKQEVARVDLAILNLQTARSNQITESLKQADDELAQMTISRRAAADQLRQAESGLGRTGAHVSSDEPFDDAVVVVRRTAGGITEIKAEDATLIHPGDIIKVQARLPGHSRSEPREAAGRLTR